MSAANDTLEDKVGFRTIAVKGDDILLNGKPIFLRGISIHEEELGANPNRRDHTASRACAALAGEGTARQLCSPGPLSAFRSHDAHGRRDGRLGVERDPGLLAGRFRKSRNARHRAATCWPRTSCATATAPPSPSGASATKRRKVTTGCKFLSTLAADAHRLDGTRLVSAALLTTRRTVNGHPEMVIGDPLIPSLDVMAVNTYNGWYGDDTLASLPIHHLAFGFRQAADLLGIGGRGAGRLPRFRRQSAQILRGIPGRILPPDLGDGREDPVPPRHVALDPEGFPLAAPPKPDLSERLEPQGPGLRNRRKERSLRRAGGLLPTPRRDVAGSRASRFYGTSCRAVRILQPIRATRTRLSI